MYNNLFWSLQFRLPLKCTDILKRLKLKLSMKTSVLTIHVPVWPTQNSEKTNI